MGDAVIRELGIPGKTSDCVQAPSDPKLDKCQVQVLEGTPTGGNNFVLERRGKDFFVGAADQARVNKLFPSFKPPVQDLKDYLLARGEFFKAFGDVHEPSDFGKSIKLSSSGASPMEIVVNYTNLLSSFIGTGQVDPKDAVKKMQLSDAVQAGTFAYADSQLGPKIAEVLGQIDKTAGLSADAKGRVAFLIAVQEAWNKLWPQLEPAANKVSSDLAKKMKFSAAQTIRFLFVNHILTDQGIKALFKDQYETGRIFFDEMSRLDVDGTQFGDYYEHLRKALKQIKTPKLPKAQQDDFNKRLALLDQTLAQAAANKIAFLANQSTQKAVKESLKLKYGDNPTRMKALDVVLKNLEVKDVSDRPNFSVNIEAISKEWRAMVNSQLDTTQKKEHVEAINYLIKQLFERNGKMQVFWQTDYQEMDNLYDTVKRSLLSGDSKTLEDLVRWALAEAEKVDLHLNPDAEPRPPLRKWWLVSEFSLAASGAGTALGFHYGAQDNPQMQYWGTGAGIMVGGIGLGAAGGNLIAYGAKVDPKYDWALHAGGGIVGGLAASLIYGFATGWGPPGGGMMPPPNDPGRRFPVDPYGP